MSEEELGTPAVQRLLLDEIDRLEACERDADTARSLFHEADKRAAVLEEKGKVSTAQEVVSIICLAVGGALLGFAPSIWSTQPVASVALALGVVLVIGGVVAKVWMQR